MTSSSEPGRSWRAAAVVGALALLALVAPVPVGAGPEDDPLAAAGRAAENVSFSGVLRVQWTSGTTENTESLLVQGGNGALVVRGGTAVMADDERRLVETSGGQWNILSPGGQAGAARIAPARKYQFSSTSGPIVNGRPSTMVDVHLGGVLVDRLYLDQATDLLLRREQFEGARQVRTIEFETLTIGGAAAPKSPSSVVNAAPKVLSAAHIPSSVSAPVALADGYKRVGLYRKSGVVQALYSDGLYGLSVFEQRGSLNRDDLPGATKVRVGPAAEGVTGWHYGWPGGHVLLWEKSGTVYTAVSDAPLEQVLTAVATLPPATATVSLLRRLRQVCRALVQPLAT